MSERARTDLTRGEALRAADRLGWLTYVGVDRRGLHQVVVADEPQWIAGGAVSAWVVGLATGHGQLAALLELVPGLLTAAGVTTPTNPPSD
jgi:hypothetical protein